MANEVVSFICNNLGSNSYFWKIISMVWCQWCDLSWYISQSYPYIGGVVKGIRYPKIEVWYSVHIGQTSGPFCSILFEKVDAHKYIFYYKINSSNKFSYFLATKIMNLLYVYPASHILLIHLVWTWPCRLWIGPFVVLLSSRMLNVSSLSSPSAGRPR